MKRLISLAALGLLTLGANAQETAPMRAPTWIVTSAVSLSEAIKVSCSLQFPSEKGSAGLRLRNTVAKGGAPSGTASFELTSPDALLSEGKGIIANTKIDIDGKSSWALKTSSWQADTGKTSGRLALVADSDVRTVLSPIAGGKVLTVTVPTDSGDKTFVFSLKGSSRAMQEFRACLNR